MIHSLGGAELLHRLDGVERLQDGLDAGCCETACETILEALEGVDEPRGRRLVAWPHGSPSSSSHHRSGARSRVDLPVVGDGGFEGPLRHAVGRREQSWCEGPVDASREHAESLGKVGVVGLAVLLLLLLVATDDCTGFLVVRFGEDFGLSRWGFLLLAGVLDVQWRRCSRLEHRDAALQSTKVGAHRTQLLVREMHPCRAQMTVGNVARKGLPDGAMRGRRAPSWSVTSREEPTVHTTGQAQEAH